MVGIAIYEAVSCKSIYTYKMEQKLINIKVEFSKAEKSNTVLKKAPAQKVSARVYCKLLSRF